MQHRSWSIRGADGQPILGDAHLPPLNVAPRGVIVIAHGFKGYKDYGMFPRIAAECAAAGFIAHRFNFSHSGMTNRTDTFERPELFERDTWSRQVFDLRAVIGAVADGAIAGVETSGGGTRVGGTRGGLPYVLFGHSRGGVTALLTAARLFNDDGDVALPRPAGVIAAAAPASCNPFSEDDAALLLRQGWLESPSSRTGQMLRVGRAFLQEQLDDPAAHDLLAHVKRIGCPILLIHGENDPTVDASCARIIADAATAPVEVKLIPGGDHVFNTPNPMPADAPISEPLGALVEAMMEFCLRVM